MPRDSQRAADELYLLLTKSGEDGPDLLGGHPLGGFLHLAALTNAVGSGRCQALRSWASPHQF